MNVDFCTNTEIIKLCSSGGGRGKPYYGAAKLRMGGTLGWEGEALLHRRCGPKRIKDGQKKLGDASVVLQPGMEWREQRRKGEVGCSGAGLCHAALEGGGRGFLQ